jgi:hypothetical protein
MKVQNEVQSMHWHSSQVPILVHITYFRNPEYNAEDSELKEILKEVHYYVSDEKEHDSIFVQHAFRLHWKFMTDQLCYPLRHIVWSDDCSAQFKAAKCWYHLGRYHSYIVCPQLPNGCEISWNYFAPGHGKGEVDGVGALLKRQLRLEQIKPNAEKIQNATDAVVFLQREANKFHAGPSSSRRTTSKHFWLVRKEDVDRSQPFDCSTVHGSRSVL